METIRTTTKSYESIRSSETLYSLTGKEAMELAEQFKLEDIPSMRKEYTKNGQYCQEFHFDYKTIVVVCVIRYDMRKWTMTELQLA